MELTRTVAENGVALVGGAAGRVRYGFTERTGGVSQAPYASLNLGTHVEDDPAAVEENRRRALAALGCEDASSRLLVPNQVHGDRVVAVGAEDATPEGLERVRADIAAGADAIVCTEPGVPVLLCFADCVPVILTCGDAFAVVHSGWRGTLAGIAGKAAVVLAQAAGRPVAEVSAAIGPHILGDEYEVSEELVATFAERFACVEADGSRLLDLAVCIRESLAAAGVPAVAVADPQLSTVRQNDRFYSFRAEHGRCGRHGAIACIR